MSLLPSLTRTRPRRLSSELLSPQRNYAHRVFRARLRLPLLLLAAGLWYIGARLLRCGDVPTLSYDGVVVDASHPHERFTGSSSGSELLSDRAAIMVYGGAKPQEYLPVMLRSAADNAHDLDLLLVNIQDQAGACLDLGDFTDSRRPTFAPNIQHLCLSQAENDALTSRWLCDGWGGCSDGDRATVAQHLERLRTELLGPDTFSTFRHFRGLIYRSHVRTRWWAYADTDLIFGRFADFMPYDIMGSFDIIFTTFFNLPTRALWTPDEFTLFKYSSKMTQAARRFPPLQSPASLAQLQPGDMHHRLAHYANSDHWLSNQTDVDILRMPDLQSEGPFMWHRRLVITDGRVLSLDRNLPRHEIPYWIRTASKRHAREIELHPHTFTPWGFTVEEVINRTEWVPCNDVPINPSFTCPKQRDTGVLRIITFRKGGVWRTRYDHRPRMSAPHQMASLQELAFAHLGEFTRSPDFSFPTLEETGYLDERAAWAATGRRAGRPGELLSVVEFSPQWWMSWTFRRGDHIVTPGAIDYGTIGDTAIDQDDTYWCAIARLDTRLIELRIEHAEYILSHRRRRHSRR